MNDGDRVELLARRRGRLARRPRGSPRAGRPALEEERVEHLVLGAEVVVDEPVGDARLVGDVRDAAGVEALAGEHADRRVEDQAALVGGLLRRCAWPSGRAPPAGSS